jgi:ABC-2 type transport system ATP-binding protein
MTVHVANLTKTYGHVVALDALSLDVQPGEIFGLLGANGAGKSTLIRTLIGALKRDSGEVSVLGMDPATQKNAIRLRVGYMPQSPALYEDLSARDNVRFFARARPVENLSGRVDAVLDFVDLLERADDPVYGFSGGMKQRLSLAVALVHEPDLLLLDEPSTGVDPKLREAFWGHFRNLAESGVTILISTHQMDEALHCDRVAVMRDGRVLACDSPGALLAQGRASVTIWRGGQAQTHTLDHYAERLPQLVGAAGDVERIEVHESTLEDVVLNLINQTTTDEPDPVRAGV